MKKTLLFIVFIILCFFLPEIASTTFGKKAIEGHFSKRLGTSIQMDEVSLHWLGNQSCKNITLQGKNGVSYSIKKLESASPLFSSPTFEMHGGKILLKNPKGLRTALILLKGKVDKKTDLPIDFEYMKGEIKNDILHLEKTSIFLDGSIQIFLDGDINLESHQADLTLGLPAKSLKKLIGLKELPADFVLEIPLSGPLDQFFLDGFTSKILSGLLRS